MKYRHKPLIVEATQWFPGKEISGVYAGTPGHYYVVTIHAQRAFLEAGDWVITEPDNIHHYPCKDSIFQAGYEPV